MGPKQKGGGGGPSRQKGNNAAEEVEESLQAVVCLDVFSGEESVDWWCGVFGWMMVADGLFVS